jgi:L-fuculose-phosphate aldolase
MTEQTLRAAIVAACRQLNDSGLNQGMAGNISVRLGDTVLITPTATPYETMRPQDIAAFPLAGGAQDATGPLRPSSEWRFHRDLLRTRDDVGAVVHAHPPYATALAIARRGIPPCHYMVATFGGEDVRCAEYATFGTAALSGAVTRAMQGRHACLMANHGMLATGRDLAQAMWRAIELEALARQFLLAQAAGGTVLLSSRDIAEAGDMFSSYRPA